MTQLAKRSGFAVAAVALALAGALAAVPAAHATTYRWVDDQGKVHYTDKLPPEAINKGNIELDKQGVPVRKTDPTLTPEQRRARAAEDARAEQLAKERELVERRDRALLGTYTSEAEIELARKRALATIDGQVQSATAYSATLGKRKAELDQRVKTLGDKPTPAVLERELANVNSELAKQAELVAAKQKEMVAVNAKYDADKKRWTELRAATAAMAAGEKDPASPLTPTTVRK